MMVYRKKRGEACDPSIKVARPREERGSDAEEGAQSQS